MRLDTLSLLAVTASLVVACNPDDSGSDRHSVEVSDDAGWTQDSSADSSGGQSSDGSVQDSSMPKPVSFLRLGESADRVVMATDGDVYIAGTVSGKYGFPDWSDDAANATDWPASSMYLARVAPNGIRKWVRVIEPDESCAWPRITALQPLSGGGVVIAGGSECAHRFGGDPSIGTKTEHGFVATYDAAGLPQWDRQFYFGDEITSYATTTAITGILVADDGSILVAGDYRAWKPADLRFSGEAAPVISIDLRENGAYIASLDKAGNKKYLRRFRGMTIGNGTDGSYRVNDVHCRGNTCSLVKLPNGAAVWGGSFGLSVSGNGGPLVFEGSTTTGGCSAGVTCVVYAIFDPATGVVASPGSIATTAVYGTGGPSLLAAAPRCTVSHSSVASVPS